MKPAQERLSHALADILAEVALAERRRPGWPDWRSSAVSADFITAIGKAKTPGLLGLLLDPEIKTNAASLRVHIEFVRVNPDLPLSPEEEPPLPDEGVEPALDDAPAPENRELTRRQVRQVQRLLVKKAPLNSLRNLAVRENLRPGKERWDIRWTRFQRLTLDAMGYKGPIPPDGTTHTILNFLEDR